ncbi:LIM/homeobox protein Lhx9-like, partial [Thrips palmi]|uniref:LIM/homeobox protein Lhx9-like n=1 Tax=Thrips palmi TaxID=161013 RepID=A0A6P8YD35_THRPL
RIADRYYLLAVDRQWHSSCLRCSECRVTLASEQTCFSRGGHIFCKEDYYRMFAVKRCARCQTAISSSELVMRARELVFHLHCFTCATCGTALARGDQFGVSPGGCHVPDGNGAGLGAGGPRPASWQAYCRPHFEQLLAACCEAHPGMKGRPRKRKLTPVPPVSPLPIGADLGHHQHLAMRLSGLSGLSAQALEMAAKGELSSSVDSLGYDSGVLPQDLSSGMESLSYDCGVGSPGSLSVQGQQRTKRMRTSFKHHQLRTMKSYFAVNQNPDAKDLKQLAQKTGLSKRVLQVWFQNARAKWRRNMMRQENGQQASGGPHGGGPQVDP